VPMKALAGPERRSIDSDRMESNPSRLRINYHDT
jgi:hypothetical protein